MKLREIMTKQVVRIHPEESAAVAARTMTHYNIGILPVCGSDGRVCGVLTDRDIVTRCLAAGKSPESTQIRDIMTSGFVAVRPDMDTSTAAALMGSRQVRRLPVMENGKLCGMVSLGDLARKEDATPEARVALSRISSNLSDRK